MTPSTSMNLSCTEGDDSIGSSNTTKSSSNTGSFDTSFNLSFASDNTDDDDEIGPSDSFDDVFSTPPIIIRPLCRPLPKGVGLGFSGVMNKDGDGPLTGLGLLRGLDTHGFRISSMLAMPLPRRRSMNVFLPDLPMHTFLNLHLPSRSMSLGIWSSRRRSAGKLS